MRVPALVIFDCDGVLVDSERLSHAVLRDMIAEYGVQLSLEQTLGYFMGTSTERCLEVLVELIGRSAPADFLAQFRDRSFDAFRQALTPVAGAQELLATLPHRYCVASNGPREKMRFTLGHTGLLPLLEDRLFSAQDVKRPKPAPDLFLHAAATFAVEPADCVVIEDSATGIVAARSAGMRVLGFSAMGQADKLLDAGANLVFGSLSDLPALLVATQSDA
jgi:HAD superfamily hydrolase (TIGR01509 family)